ncbi:hypothetical protein HMPREF0972_00901 [Actinomyces sp. oral taxon 848 str. F0332]|nr:hypothetical protein HMPREF0972_00901 [Actinomyces sp. oral taxon 848 str. F0332]
MLPERRSKQDQLLFLTRDGSLSIKTEQHAPPFSFHWLYPAIRRTARARPSQREMKFGEMLDLFGVHQPLFTRI